ncbi:MAG: isoprenylcysteine carboxylmethyltransferase family protein [Deltaproteobacteria bacterium]|nr:isoprenylcysteine carboxylmethyltransferase family protein [Deltaproteobacteria bacterium]
MTPISEFLKSKKAVGALFLFYLIIGFEFFYMASPFAVYFYSVYGPGLNFLNNNPAFFWLSGLFRPHIVAETTSTLLNLRNVIGGILSLGGFLGFCIAAAQVYYKKVTRKEAVTGGLYKWIRHPQYVSLLVCGLGMLLLWPRYLVLLSFTAMIFVYYFLAKFEERECEQKYGKSYLDYKLKTYSFLPFPLPWSPKQSLLPKSGFRRVLGVLTLYILITAAALSLAVGLKTWSLFSLYGVYTEEAANISLTKIDPETLNEIIKIALSHPFVKSRIDVGQDIGKRKFINYILPSPWYVSEIPMNPVPGVSGGPHPHSRNFDRNKLRIVFTRAELRGKGENQGLEILRKAVRTEPILEVLVDASQKKVTGFLEPPIRRKYAGIPVPLF